MNLLLFFKRKLAEKGVPKILFEQDTLMQNDTAFTSDFEKGRGFSK
jgi:hypothetical protein